MTDKLKKQLILNLPYLVFVYLFDKLCQGVRLAPGVDASEKLLHIGQGFSAAFTSLAPSFHLLDLCAGAAGAVLIRLAVYSKGKNAKKYRRGIEYGSARWGTPADIAPYAPTFSCRPMHRPNTQTARPYGTPWKKPSVERTPSLHTALTLPCRMNFPLRKTSLLQGNFCWRTL